MKILVIYHLLRKNGKSTINEHLYSFKRYSNEECCYLNTAYGIPSYITKIDFDAIIYHHTLWDPSVRLNESGRLKTLRKYGLLKESKGYKVAIAQDEYRCSDRMNDFFSDFGIKTVFTLVQPAEWQKVYPREKSGLEYYFTVFAGYIDELALERLAKSNQRHKSRPIDVGYRGYKPPYWLGKYGMLKWELADNFENLSVKHNLKFDLSSNFMEVLYGDKWYKFLGRCRVVLGCEGGASLRDPDGSIMRKVDQYVSEHPEASFGEVEAVCFPGIDGNLNYFAPSPRHFEACITRTCQALVEGEYGGIFKPGVHYIEIKKDWSNIPDVIRQIEDVEFCEQIADNAYRDIVESGLYTYRNFVQLVLNHVRDVRGVVSYNSPDDSYYSRLLERREKFPFIFSPFTFSIIHIKRTIFPIKHIIYKILVRLNLYDDYRKVKSIFKKITTKMRLKIWKS